MTVPRADDGRGGIATSGRLPPSIAGARRSCVQLLLHDRRDDAARTPEARPRSDRTHRRKTWRRPPPSSWYSSFWRGLRSGAPTPARAGVEHPGNYAHRISTAPATAPEQRNNSEYLLKNCGRDDPGRIFTAGVPSSRNNQWVTKPRACPPGTRQEQLSPT
jgi:hypothetical protein